ncbi:TPA: cell division protein FtsA [Candidatus Uhrbacteria bacterium]|nr:cell division protein FtsA [Candidatus Uhrbacteria bacterium]
MRASPLLTGVDIGSSMIRIVVGQRVQKEHGVSDITVLGAVEIPSQGISKGSVTSIDDAVASISKCLEHAERMTGQPLQSAWVGIGGTHIIAQESKGVIGVARSDGEIREEDVDRAIEAARTVATPSNHEILHVIPKSFTVDGQRGVKDPVGMTGIRLEVDALIIQGLTSQIKNVTKAVYRTGLNIDDLVFSILATGEAVLSQKQKELGSVVINVGAQTTSVIVYEEGDVLHVAVLQIGADHITSDIAIGLRTSIDVAEQIKLTYGTALKAHTDRSKKILVSEFGALGDESCTHQFLAEIIHARAEELFEKVDEELVKIDRSGLLPAGVFLTGGGAKLAGMTEVAKDVLRLPVTYGTPIGVSSAVEQVHDVGFTTAIGLIKWAQEIEGSKNGSIGGIVDRLKNMDQLGNMVKGWVKGLMP